MSLSAGLILHICPLRPLVGFMLLLPQTLESIGAFMGPRWAGESWPVLQRVGAWWGDKGAEAGAWGARSGVVRAPFEEACDAFRSGQMEALAGRLHGGRSSSLLLPPWGLCRPSPGGYRGPLRGLPDFQPVPFLCFLPIAARAMITKDRWNFTWSFIDSPTTALREHPNSPAPHVGCALPAPPLACLPALANCWRVPRLVALLSVPFSSPVPMPDLHCGLCLTLKLICHLPEAFLAPLCCAVSLSAAALLLPLSPWSRRLTCAILQKALGYSIVVSHLHWKPVNLFFRALIT